MKSDVGEGVLGEGSGREEDTFNVREAEFRRSWTKYNQREAPNV